MKPPRIVDLRGLAKYAALAEAGKAPTRPIKRDPASLDRIILHQWGAVVGVSSAARRRVAEGKSSELLELATRATRAPYHFGAGCDSSGQGFAVRAWEPWVYTWASNALNRRSLAVGIMGRFPKMSARWVAARHTPLDQVEPLMAAGRLAVELAAANIPEADDPPLVLTHSQIIGEPSGHDRSSDPGEIVIELVVAPLVAAGVIRVDPDHAQDHGDPWPEAWRRHVEASG